MIKMKTMKHILRSLILLPVLAGALAVSCNKSSGEGPNVAIKRQFDAWRAIHYPDAVEKDGIYIIEDTPGTGLEWNKNLPVTFLQYTIRSLDGSVSYTSEEAWFRQLGTWSPAYYYGPQTTFTGENVSYAGVDAILDGMKQGGRRTAIIPSWMFTKNRYSAPEEYLNYETEIAAFIYSVTFLQQTTNFAEYEYEQLRNYSLKNWQVPDTLSTGAVFFKSFTEFEEEPVEMPQDTTVYINYTGRRVYDDQVFDTTIADTAKFYNIYDPSRSYVPVAVTWGESAEAIQLSGSTVITGFGLGLFNMHAGEKASFAFGYNLGYGSSGGTDSNMIPPYAALRFDVEMVPEP